MKCASSALGCPELNRGNGVTTSDHIPPVGNRLTQTRSGDIQDHGLITYSYNAGDELLIETLPKQTNTYNYDANGNTIKRIETRLPGPPNPNPPKNKPYVPPAPLIDEFAFTWDHENRLVGYDAPGPSKDSTYVYYADWWNRIDKTVNRNTERYLYDGDEIICDYDRSGSFSAMYVNGPIIDERLAMLRDGQLYYYLTDHLGSVHQLIDTAGNIKNSCDYEAFGEKINPADRVPNRYTFNSREEEQQTGLIAYRFRGYIAGIGRFATVDPLPLYGGNNLYAYAQNNPTSRVDPYGLWSLRWREVRALSSKEKIAITKTICVLEASSAVSPVVVRNLKFILEKGHIMAGEPKGQVTAWGETIGLFAGETIIMNTRILNEQSFEFLGRYLIHEWGHYLWGTWQTTERFPILSGYCERLDSAVFASLEKLKNRGVIVECCSKERGQYTLHTNQLYEIAAKCSIAAFKVVCGSGAREIRRYRDPRTP